MVIIKETWRVEQAWRAVLWVSRLYGIAPLRFRPTRASTVAYVSRPIYYIGVLFICVTNLIVIADLVYRPEGWSVTDPTPDPKDSKNNNRLLAILNILITAAGTLYCAFNSVLKMKRYLHLTSEINKIKNSLNYSCYISGPKLWHAICLLTLLLFELWILPLVNFWEYDDSMIKKLTFACCLIVLFLFSVGVSVVFLFNSMIANFTLYGSLSMMVLHFVFVALQINSSFEVINKCLARVLSEISRESLNQYNSRSLSRNAFSYSYIPITSINKTIDLLGNVRQEVKMTSRMKFAREICAISSSFARTCEVMRDLNHIENIYLLVHVFVITMNLVITINNLVLAMCCTTDLKYMTVTTECVWFVCHTFRIVLIVEPCHRIQEELSQTKMLLAHIMCEVTHEADPLFDATDDFFKQLHLNDVSITVMGIFSLRRSTISTIIGGAATLYVVLLEL